MRKHVGNLIALGILVAVGIAAFLQFRDPMDTILVPARLTFQDWDAVCQKDSRGSKCQKEALPNMVRVARTDEEFKRLDEIIPIESPLIWSMISNQLEVAMDFFYRDRLQAGISAAQNPRELSQKCLRELSSMVERQIKRVEDVSRLASIYRESDAIHLCVPWAS